MSRKRRRIAIIGSGNVASHLANALYQTGNEIAQIWSRKYEHAVLLAKKVNAKPIERLEDLNKDCDAYIISVKDDAIADVARCLELGDALVMHTSGTVDIEVLRQSSTRTGVIWAPQSFVKDIEMDYTAIPFCIEACTDNTAKEICEIVNPISGHVFVLSGEQRKWAHLASVIVNNFGNALNAIAQEQLREHKIPFEILHSLIEMTAERAKQPTNLWRIQTGPAARNDVETINAHRHLIADQPELLRLYETMTQLIKNATH